MTIVASLHEVTKRYGRFTAVDDMSFGLRENSIHGLLGRNGAGKTTLMRMLAGHVLPTSGQVRAFGESPWENNGVLERICLVSEGQPYPEGYCVRHVLEAARLLFSGWDEEYAQGLLRDFELPLGRAVKKLSRGMLSAVGIVVGLASRAPLTLFDEPYLGLDAVARQLFYDRLLADFAEHPRTVVLSTHLIDEVSDLLERVLLVDRGRLLLDEDADHLRDRAVTATGPAAVVERWAAGREVLHTERLASFARVTVVGPLEVFDRDRAHREGLDLEPVSLQQLVVRTAVQHRAGTGAEPSSVEIPEGALR